MSLIISTSKGSSSMNKKNASFYSHFDNTRSLERPNSLYSVFFNGVSSTISGISNTNVTNAGTTSFTIEAWVRLKSPSTSFISGIFSNRTTNGFTFYISGDAATPNRTVTLDTLATTGTRTISGTTKLEIGKWHHIAVTYKYVGGNLNVATLYLDGSIEASLSTMSNIVTATAATYIGWDQNNSAYYFCGDMTEFRYWNRVKSQEEILEGMNRRARADENGLLLYYPMDEGSGSTTKNMVNQTSANLNSTVWTTDVPDFDTSIEKDIALFQTNIALNKGSISDDTLRHVRKFVSTLKTHGVWQRLSEIGVFCGDNLAAASVKLKYRSGITPFLSPVNIVESDYVERGSFGGVKGTGNAGAKYFDTAFLGLFNNDNGHLCAYVKGTDSVNAHLVGRQGGTNFTALGWLNGASWEVGTLLGDSASHYVPQSATTKREGMLMVTAKGSISQYYYANGQQIGLPVNAKTPTANMPSYNFFVMASNSIGSPINHTTRYMRAYSIGLGLSSEEQAIYYVAMREFQEALGRGI